MLGTANGLLEIHKKVCWYIWKRHPDDLKTFDFIAEHYLLMLAILDI